MEKAIFCPECGHQLSKFGPEQNDSDSPFVKTVKMECKNCGRSGRVWEAKINNGVVAEIKFVKALFRDFDHR